MERRVGSFVVRLGEDGEFEWKKLDLSGKKSPYISDIEFAQLRDGKLVEIGEEWVNFARECFSYASSSPVNFVVNFALNIPLRTSLAALDIAAEAYEASKDGLPWSDREISLKSVNMVRELYYALLEISSK